jgi:LAGLIDADG DNA endonuclease family protein
MTTLALNQDEAKNESLPGDYIAGFVDGEGCFYLTYRSEIKYSRVGQPKYYRWLPYFAIMLRSDDVEILYKIRATLACGNVYYSRNKSLTSFNVQNINDLYGKILPFFEKFELRAKKRLDFELWKQALIILYGQRNHRGQLDLAINTRLEAIRMEMRQYKGSLNKAYKNRPHDP